MALLNTGFPTLLDQVRMRDPNGAIAKVVEMLSQSNPLIEEAVFIEGNLATGHRVTTETGLPSGSWRKFNEGVAETKGSTDQFDETCGMLEAFSKIDVGLANLHGDAAAFRAAKDGQFVRGLANQLETAFFYQSLKTAPESIMGLSPRMDTKSGGANGEQIFLHTAGAAGSDQASIWLVGWGPETVAGIFPKGQVGGLVPTDMGVQLVKDANNRDFRAYVTHWLWNTGLAVIDKRYLVRGANIDTSALSATNDDLVPLMLDMIGQLKDTQNCKPVFYVNRKIRTMLRKQARNATKNSTLDVNMVEGKPVLSIDGIPIRMSDALLNTEAVIS